MPPFVSLPPDVFGFLFYFSLSSAKHGFLVNMAYLFISFSAYRRQYSGDVCIDSKRVYSPHLMSTSMRYSAIFMPGNLRHIYAFAAVA